MQTKRKMEPARPRRRASLLGDRRVQLALIAIVIAGAIGFAIGVWKHHAPIAMGGLAVAGGAAALFAYARFGLKRMLVYSGVSVLAGAALVTLTIVLTFWYYARDPRLPSVDQLKNYHPKQVTRILAKDDTLLGEIYTERRSVVKYDDLPPMLVDAFVAAEDEHFWEHGGVDYKGMIRAFFVNMFSGETKQGASTITQQVIKNLLLTPEKTFRRKIQEVILARRLESSLTKQEIFALYVNTIYLGQGRYGVMAAARYYFGVKESLKELTPCQMAYLASLPPAPEAISSDKKVGGDHLVHVLNRMVELGKMDLATAQSCANMDVPPYAHPPGEAVAPEVADLVKAQLEQQYGKDKLDTLGATVHVTVRPDVQAMARAALQKRLRAYDKSHKVGMTERKVAPADVDRELAKMGKKLPKDGPADGDIDPAIVKAVDDKANTLSVDLGGVTEAVDLAPDDERFNPDHQKPSQRFAPNDLVDVVIVHAGAARLAPGPEGSVVVIDVKTRDVVALVGGFHVHAGEFDRAVQAHRQAGSTFKPFTYAAAIQSKKYTPASIVADAPDVYDLYKPKDYEGSFQGPVRLRYALAQSLNTVAIRVCADIGPPAVAAMAHAMGVESDLPDGAKDYSVALGAGAVTPLEMTNAFATFATYGMFQPPRIVESVDGQLAPSDDAKRALPADVSYVILDMMRSVLEKGGTGAGAQKDLKVPVVGKTGTSNDERDAWFMGLTPDYAIGVWVGYDDNRPLGKKMTGGALALPVFVDVINQIGVRGHTFERPAGITVAKIDKATGLLAPDGAAPDTTLDEVFLDGTQPTEVAPSSGEVTTNTFVTDEYGDDDAQPAPATTPQ